MTAAPAAVGLDFAPLFGSVESMAALGGILRELLAHAGYREHLRARAAPQPVLIGYSEAGRECGYLAMRVAAYDAQRSAGRGRGEAGVPIHDPACARRQHGARRRAPGRRGRVRRHRIPSMACCASPSRARPSTRTMACASRRCARWSALSVYWGSRRWRGAAVRRSAKLPRITTLAARLAARSQAVSGVRCAWTTSSSMISSAAATPIDVIERMQIGSRSLWEGKRHRRAGHPLHALGVRLVAGRAASCPAGTAPAPRCRNHWPADGLPALRELYRGLAAVHAAAG